MTFFQWKKCMSMIQLVATLGNLGSAYAELYISIAMTDASLTKVCKLW